MFKERYKCDTLYSKFTLALFTKDNVVAQAKSLLGPLKISVTTCGNIVKAYMVFQNYACGGPTFSYLTAVVQELCGAEPPGDQG